MNNAHQQIHLIPERGSGSFNSEARQNRYMPSLRSAVVEDHNLRNTMPNSLQLPALTVPAKPAWLVSSPGMPPRLTRIKPRKKAAAFLVEPVMQRSQLRLLLICPQERRVRLNGIIAPRFVVLKEKDCIHMPSDVALHVTIFNRPCVGPVSTKFVGKECPICRVPFAAGVRSYTCACGAAMHCESDGTTDVLQCAQLCSGSGCPVCQKPVVLKQGYSYLPEVANE
jgi:hypothetical protein